ncbi:hypothetical protein GCM10009069_14210 [Algimonas arctica]|uniref:Uncharacterized protein n=1 Tax=Algimonas arctica TaxID=1479486 RepID=A0A8J3G270_9PROT|nr:hypothetical protein [Algimonas arctica]GHA92354.1 hypothetical protein GCM10009069_14210 [Algimonas arctica]
MISTQTQAPISAVICLHFISLPVKALAQDVVEVTNAKRLAIGIEAEILKSSTSVDVVIDLVTEGKWASMFDAG